MRELVLEEVAMVSGGYTPGEDGPSGGLPNQSAGSDEPWWGAFDYNGDGDLWDEGAIWFGGAGAAMGLAAGGMAVTGVGAPAAGATGIAAGISGSIGGLLAVGDYYFGQEGDS